MLISHIFPLDAFLFLLLYVNFIIIAQPHEIIYRRYMGNAVPFRIPGYQIFGGMSVQPSIGILESGLAGELLFFRFFIFSAYVEFPR